MSGWELKGQPAGPVSWHPPDTVLSWSKQQCCRAREMQARAAVTPPVQLMATWSGQREKYWDARKSPCSGVSQFCGRWQNSSLGKGATSQAIRRGNTQSSEWWYNQTEADCKLCFVPLKLLHKMNKCIDCLCCLVPANKVFAHLCVYICIIYQNISSTGWIFIKLAQGHHWVYINN